MAMGHAKDRRACRRKNKRTVEKRTEQDEGVGRLPSRGGALSQPLQNHLQKIQFRCWEMTGTIAGKSGVCRCRKINSLFDSEMTVLF